MLLKKGVYSMNIKQINNIIASTVVATAAVFGGWLSSAKAAILRTYGSEEAVGPFIVTPENPDNYIVKPGTGFDGVVQLLISTNQGRFLCSGSLLNSGRHILTAAHCLTDDFGNLIANSTSVFFDLPDARVTLDTDKFFVHPDWDGFADFESSSGDIAILELLSEAPLAAQRYEIYRTQDEIGKVGVKVGYGLSGTGNEGAVFGIGVKRSGQNKYDALAEVLNPLPGTPDVVPGTYLAYDFDNGLPENDAFGVFLGIKDLGLGLLEVNTAPGDSGGPTFINGLIAGITSYGLCPTVTFEDFNCIDADIDNFLNNSFGEFGVDTRVSTYASWVDGITGVHKVPEPGMVGALFLTGAATLLSRKHSRKQVNKV